MLFGEKKIPRKNVGGEGLSGRATKERIFLRLPLIQCVTNFLSNIEILQANQDIHTVSLYVL